MDVWLRPPWSLTTYITGIAGRKLCGRNRLWALRIEAHPFCLETSPASAGLFFERAVLTYLNDKVGRSSIKVPA